MCQAYEMRERGAWPFSATYLTHVAPTKAVHKPNRSDTKTNTCLARCGTCLELFLADHQAAARQRLPT
jgi:hypothetical protein